MRDSFKEYYDDIEEVLKHLKDNSNDSVFTYTNFYKLVESKRTERELEDDKSFVESLLDEVNSQDTAYILNLTDTVVSEIRKVCDDILDKGMSSDLVDTEKYDGDLWLKTIKTDDIPDIVLMQNKVQHEYGTYLSNEDVLALTVLNKKGMLTKADAWRLSTPEIYSVISHELRHKIDVMKSKGQGFKLHPRIDKYDDEFKNYSNSNAEVKAFTQEIIAMMKKLFDLNLDNQFSKYYSSLNKTVDFLDVKNSDILKNVIRNLFYETMTRNRFVYLKYNSLTKRNKKNALKQIYNYFTNEFLREYDKYSEIIDTNYKNSDAIRFNAWKQEKPW